MIHPLFSQICKNKCVYFPKYRVIYDLKDSMVFHVRIWCPELKSGHVQIFIFQCIFENLDTSRFSFCNVYLKIWTHPDFHFVMYIWKSGLDISVHITWKPKSRFSFLDWKIKIWTCPDFYFSMQIWKSGHVQIFIFQCKFENLDLISQFISPENLSPDFHF